jgi:hypothetical protein
MISAIVVRSTLAEWLSNFPISYAGASFRTDPLVVSIEHAGRIDPPRFSSILGQPGGQTPAGGPFNSRCVSKPDCGTGLAAPVWPCCLHKAVDCGSHNWNKQICSVP